MPEITCRIPSPGIRHLIADFPPGGGERIRTADPLLAKQVLSQLSYAPGQRTDARCQRSDARFRHPLF